MSIPKIIHQTLPSKRKIDPDFETNITNLKRLNPGWEHRLYDDEDLSPFILRHFGQDILDCFELIDPRYGAARADFFRYLLMYVEGGVYLDIKSTATRPLDEVLHEDDEYILSRWHYQSPEEIAAQFRGVGIGPDGEYQQWHIICAPAHPFLKSVIEKIKSNIEAGGVIEGGTGFTGVMYLTGPVAYTRAIQTMTGEHPHRKVNIQNLGFEYSFLPRNAHRDRLSGHHYSVLGFPLLRFPKNVVTDQLISTLSSRFNGAIGNILKSAFLARLNGGTAKITTFHGTNLFYLFELDRCIHQDHAHSCLHVPVLFELFGSGLVFFVEVGGLRIRLGVNESGHLSSQFDATDQGAAPVFQIGEKAGGCFTLLWRRRFLCAESGGKLVFDRTAAERWESFSVTYDRPEDTVLNSLNNARNADETRYHRAV